MIFRQIRTHKNFFTYPTTPTKKSHPGKPLLSRMSPNHLHVTSTVCAGDVSIAVFSVLSTFDFQDFISVIQAPLTALLSVLFAIPRKLLRLFFDPLSTPSRFIRSTTRMLKPPKRDLVDEFFGILFVVAFVRFSFFLLGAIIAESNWLASQGFSEWFTASAKHIPYCIGCFGAAGFRTFPNPAGPSTEDNPNTRLQPSASAPVTDAGVLALPQAKPPIPPSPNPQPPPIGRPIGGPVRGRYPLTSAGYFLA